MKTSVLPPPAPKWLLLDAEGQTIGKVAVKAAHILRGKHRTAFAPHQLGADHIVIINASKLKLPPKKGIRKTYYRHTGYPGNMKVTRLDAMMGKRPTYVLEHAVKGMLPPTRLRVQMLKRLHVFADAEHPYAPQKPETLSLTPSR